MITEAEAARADTLPLEKKVNGKLVRVGQNRVGWTLNGTWMWSEWATARYTREFLDMARAYAEDQ